MLQHCGTRGRRQSSSEPLLSSPAEIDSEAASVSLGRGRRRRRRQAWQGHLQHESRGLSARRRLQAATAQLEEANAITALSSTVVRRGEDGEGGGGRESGNEGSTRGDAPEEEEEEEEDGERNGYCYCCGGHRASRWRGRLERVFRRRRRGSEDVVVRKK